MSIVALDKLTVFGTSDQKSDVLDGLQRLGCLHLINLQSKETQQPELVSKEAREALRYLLACPVRRRQTMARTHYNRESLIDGVLTIKHTREQLTAERDHLQTAIADLEPWGDFRLPSTNELPDTCLWFYVLPIHDLHAIPDHLVWRVANRDSRFAYVIVLSEQPPADMPVGKVDLDRRPLSELLHRREVVEEELEDLHWQRVTLTRWCRLLQQDLDAADDKAAQVAAAAGSWDDDVVFAVQGWLPRSVTEDVRAFAAAQHLALTIEKPSAEDAPPTLLQNPKRIAGAEDCVTFYITPGYHAWDPTTIVYFSFSLFFAMIVADAGYGLVMAGIVAFLWRKLGRADSGVRFRNLLLGIVTATIIYGIGVGSYFGSDPPTDSLLDRLRIRIDGQPMMANQTAMMILSVAIGVAHLSLANTIAAWNERRSLRCLGHLGWAMIMIGAFMFGVGAMSTTSDWLGDVGRPLVIIGAIAVLLFSTERPLATTSFKAHAGRLLDGVMQFANVSKAFGDSLSYLRLFALGLASAQLAVTFNGLAADASKQGGIGVLLAILIFAVGHGINFLLGLMGGVVHGLRLNCIEFFNWSLNQEGYAFQPFRKKAET